MRNFAGPGNREGLPGPIVQMIVEAATALGPATAGARNHRADAAVCNKVVACNKPGDLEFVARYRECMQVIYQKCTGVQVFDDADIFLSCIVTAETLQGVIAKAVKFAAFFGAKSWDLGTRVEGDHAIFTVDTRLSGDSAYNSLIDISAVSGFYKLFSWLVDRPLRGVKVSIAQRRLTDDFLVQDLLDCPVRFEGTVNTLVFPRFTLDYPVVRTYRELIAALASSPFELTALPVPERLSMQLEALFRKALHDQQPLPSLQEVAQQFGHSCATVKRTLLKESTSFRVIVDQCRREKAMELLRGTEYTVEDIAYRLGFSAPSGFFRAFKDWTGHTPAAYRQLFGAATGS